MFPIIPNKTPDNDDINSPDIKYFKLQGLNIKKGTMKAIDNIYTAPINIKKLLILPPITKNKKPTIILGINKYKREYIFFFTIHTSHYINLRQQHS